MLPHVLGVCYKYKYKDKLCGWPLARGWSGRPGTVRQAIHKQARPVDSCRKTDRHQCTAEPIPHIHFATSRATRTSLDMDTLGHIDFPTYVKNPVEPLLE